MLSSNVLLVHGFVQSGPIPQSGEQQLPMNGLVSSPRAVQNQKPTHFNVVCDVNASNVESAIHYRKQLVRNHRVNHRSS
jgi:hypothetical protein